MEEIPLVYVNNKKIRMALNERPISLKNLYSKLQSFELIYVLDKTGLQKNAPNLDIYQKLSKHHKLWIDAGPRNLGDIVDFIMAGASQVTVPLPAFTEENVEKIRELTDQHIYAGLQKKQINAFSYPLLNKLDGIVINLGERLTPREEKKLQEIKNRYQHQVYILDRKRNCRAATIDGVLTELRNISTKTAGEEKK